MDFDALGDVAVLLGAGAALLTVGGALRTAYRRTLGRRRDRYERLARLGTGAQLSFFTAVLGEPPAIKRSLSAEVNDNRGAVEAPARVNRKFTECFYIDRDYYVQTLSDVDETVLAFSVTTRSRRFKPTFAAIPTPNTLRRKRWEREHAMPYPAPLYEVRLGRSRFSDVQGLREWGPPQTVKVAYGARSFSYSELYYFGNPGHYQTHVFTASDASGRWPDVSVEEAWRDVGAAGTDGQWSNPMDEREGIKQWHELTAVDHFRRHALITTFTLIGPFFSAKDYPVYFGPHGDEVRTLP